MEVQADRPPVAVSSLRFPKILFRFFLLCSIRDFQNLFPPVFQLPETLIDRVCGGGLVVVVCVSVGWGYGVLDAAGLR